PLIVASSLVTSHASALFAIAPLALVPLAVPLRVPMWEPVVQSLSLVLLTVVVFALAGALALTFLIITTLMWGAYRLPPLVVAVQTVVLAVAATLATAAGIGPFDVLLDTDVRGAIFALQLFVMTHAAAALFVLGQSADWNASVDTFAERERDATLVADELLQLNMQKDDFISAVSHELRTPVTSILGFSEQLVDSQLDPETEQAGRIIYRNARRLADVIEDVLQLSRLSTTQGSTRPPADLDARRLLSDCVDDTLGLVASSRDVRVDLQLPEHPVIIHAVEQDLVRIVSNLLTNALKFSPPGGTVAVSLTEPVPSSIEVRIVDEGPGIPLGEQEAVWERFYRVQSPQHRDVPGTGLGLPIVRALVENRVGGQVTLSSDGEHGTTVVLRIPRVPLAVEAPQSGAA
ncbi:MAG: HAMP domain-containing sensor histidine kinase, partial [Microcella sp.]|nr:HAMP domain-containing sensor histidine kinase [Microcella sp.]